MVWPVVRTLNLFKSAGICQSNWLSFPMALFWAMATMIEMGFIGCWMWDVGCGMWDVGWWMLDGGWWMVDVDILVYELPQTPWGLNVYELGHLNLWTFALRLLSVPGLLNICTSAPLSARSFELLNIKPLNLWTFESLNLWIILKS